MTTSLQSTIEMLSNHRHKRHIVSDFAYCNNLIHGTEGPITEYPSYLDPLKISLSGLSSPSLPNEIQSSLLTVGMRIRQAVSDGYQASPIEPQRSPLRWPHPKGSYELEPYSKILSIGNFNDLQYHVEDAPSEDDLPVLDFEDLDNLDSDSFPSSQYSSASRSQASTPKKMKRCSPLFPVTPTPHSRKRVAPIDDADVAEPSPLFLSLPTQGMTPPLRRIATPKSRKMSVGRDAEDDYKMGGWEEAEFLKPLDEWGSKRSSWDW